MGKNNENRASRSTRIFTQQSVSNKGNDQKISKEKNKSNSNPKIRNKYLSVISCTPLLCKLKGN